MCIESKIITRQFCKTELRCLLHIQNGDKIEAEELLVLGFETTQRPDENYVLSFPLMYFPDIGICTESDIHNDFSNPCQIEILSPFDTPMTPESVREGFERIAAGNRKYRETQRRKAKALLDEGKSSEEIARKIKTDVCVIEDWVAKGAPVEVTE
jgi:hypothetical protein